MYFNYRVLIYRPIKPYIYTCMVPLLIPNGSVDTVFLEM